MSSEQTNPPTRLLALLEAYGADASRWPAEDRDLGETEVDLEPDLAPHRAEAAALDRLLDLAPLPVPSASLLADVLASAEPSPLRRGIALLWPFGPAWQPASVLAMSAVLGLLMGPTLPVSNTPSIEVTPGSSTGIESLVFGAGLGDEEQP